MTKRVGVRIEEGDIVGVAVYILDKNRQIVGTKVMVRGQVSRVYKISPRGHWRADIIWGNKAKAFIYTGKTDWAYLHELVLVSKKPEVPKPPRARPTEADRSEARINRD